MKKAWIIGASALLLLSGCVSEDTYGTLLNTQVQTAETAVLRQPDHMRKYYACYVQPSIGVIYAGETDAMFNFRGTKFIMRVNTEKILRRAYYPDSDAEETVFAEDPVLYYSGSCLDLSGDDLVYTLSFYACGPDYAVDCEAGDVSFFAVCSALEAVNLSGTMIRMARTVTVDEDAVIEDFSSRRDITYTASRPQLFKNLVPENGKIDEILVDGGEDETPESAAPQE